MPRIIHDLTVAKPDYAVGSIVNLMRSIGDACGAPVTPYAPFPGIEDRLRDAKQIVLLVIDGLGMELLRSAGRDTVIASHQCAEMTSVYPPTTATAITSFMTGLAPQQHGLTGWFMHFRAIGTVTAVLPFVPRFGSRSLAASGVAIGSLIGGPNFFDTLKCSSSALLPEAIYDSEFSRLFGGRAQRESYTSLNDFAEKLSGYCAGGGEAHYLYAYWSELDRLSHMHGPSSPIVAAHIDEIDQALAPIVEACADSGTVLIVTADHGFIDSGAAERIDLTDHPELVNMLSLPLCGEPRSAYCYVRPQCTHAFEQYVGSELADVADLVPSEQLIDEAWFGLGMPHPELSARIGDYTLQMRDCYTIADTLPGEKRLNMNGVHGGTAVAELYVPLILSGP